MRGGDLLLQCLHLCAVERLISHLTKNVCEVPVRRQADVAGDVFERGVQIWKRRIVEIVAMINSLDLVERRVTSTYQLLRAVSNVLSGATSKRNSPITVTGPGVMPEPFQVVR